MAAGAERQMNLAALQQRDPYITSIVDTASQVALYCFNPKVNEWEKTSVEGTLFVYSRSASPINGFMILNRLGLNDLIEPINRNLEFQLQDPFLLYRNEKASIFGIWFYDKDECARIGQLMNSLVQVAAHSQETRDSGRQRRASESDTMVDRTGSGSSTGSDAGGAVGGGTSTSLLHGGVNTKGNVDILQMLSKALDEYDKSKPVLSSMSKTEPKPLIDNPNASAMTLSDLIRPKAMKASSGQEASTGDLDQGAACSGATAGASGALEPSAPNHNVNTLEKLFRQASLHHESNTRKSVSLASPSGPPADQIPQFLQRLMSNSGATVAEIERQQRGEMPRDQMPDPVGEEAPCNGANGVVSQQVLNSDNKEPESPNTALKRSLNILPPITWEKPAMGGSTGSGKLAHESHDPLLRTFTVPDLLGASSTSSDIPYSATITSNGVTFSRPLLAATNGDCARECTKPQVLEPEIKHSKTVVCDSNTAGVHAVGLASNLDTEGLVTPQALLQTAAASHPSSVTTQGSSSQLKQTGNVLLSPMVFQSSRKTPITSVQLIQQTGGDVMSHFMAASSDSHSVKSSSPLDTSVDITSRLPVSPASSPAPTNITPLTRSQLQQALLHLIQNDNEFIATLHEAYVKSLNLVTRGGGSDRS